MLPPPRVNHTGEPPWAVPKPCLSAGWYTAGSPGAPGASAPPAGGATIARTDNNAVNRTHPTVPYRKAACTTGFSAPASPPSIERTFAGMGSDPLVLPAQRAMMCAIKWRDRHDHDDGTTGHHSSDRGVGC